MAYRDMADRTAWKAADRSEPCSKCGHLTMHRDRVCKACRAEHRLNKPCSEGCGRMTRAQSGRCGHCQWHASAHKGKSSALSGKYDGPELIYARDVCPHPLASRLPAWTGRYCGICNALVLDQEEWGRLECKR